jgi:hypothetical protein
VLNWPAALAVAIRSPAGVTGLAAGAAGEVAAG